MIKWLTWCIVILMLAGCSKSGNGSLTQEGLDLSNKIQEPVNDFDAQPEVQIVLQDYGMAPELSNDAWINTEQPLRLADLRGRVVLIDMWTYG